MAEYSDPVLGWQTPKVLIKNGRNHEAFLRLDLAGRDVIWSVESEPGAFEPWSETADAQPLEGPIYEAKEPGRVTLQAGVPLLGRSARFELDVTEGE